MMNSTLADKLNQKRGIFTDDEMKGHIKEIIRRIEGGKKVTDAVTVKAKKEKDDKGFFMNCPLVPVSIGELLDKITILQIKSEYISESICS